MIAVFALIFTACLKDNFNSDQDIHPDVPFFKTSDDYKNSRSRIFSFSLQELKEYEDSRGYKSFGRTCDELYKSINPEDFKDLAQLTEFVEEHKDYLQLSQGSDGYLTLEVVDYKNPYRYFVNEERLFQISTEVYKVIGDYYLITDEKNIDVLRSINLGNIEQFVDDTQIRTFKYRNTDNNLRLKDDTYNCGTTDQDDDQTDDRERIAINLSIHMDDIIYASTCVYSHYLVKAYRRTIFWFAVDRDLYAHIDVTNDWYTNAWFRTSGTYTKNFDSIDESKLEEDIGFHWLSTKPNTYFPHYYHWGGYYFDAKQDECSYTVNLSCNEGLVDH